MTRWSLRGTIAAAGFASGDRFVVGRWDDTPIGPLCDVMWARPDGHRTLLVGDQAGADFITAVYRFDAVEVVPTEVRGTDRWLEVTAGPVELQLQAGRGWRIPVKRPAWCTRFVEAPVARLALGVRPYGTSPTGVREWYRADAYRRVARGWASVDGRDLGALGPLDPPCRFGFSEAPKQPSIVVVRPLLEDLSGQLDRVLLDAARHRVRPG